MHFVCSEKESAREINNGIGLCENVKLLFSLSTRHEERKREREGGEEREGREESERERERRERERERREFGGRQTDRCRKKDGKRHVV